MSSIYYTTIDGKVITDSNGKPIKFFQSTFVLDSDPFFSSVKALIHGREDITLGSATWVPDSQTSSLDYTLTDQTGKEFNLINGVNINKSTNFDRSNWFSGAIYIGGTGTSVIDNQVFQSGISAIGQTDFTFEFWYYKTSNFSSTTRNVLQSWGADIVVVNDPVAQSGYNNTFLFKDNLDSGNETRMNDFSLVNNQWNHISLTREYNSMNGTRDIYAHVNGIYKLLKQVPAAFPNGSYGSSNIGVCKGQLIENERDIYFQDIRWTVDARYPKSNISLPTKQFGNF